MSSLVRNIEKRIMADMKVAKGPSEYAKDKRVYPRLIPATFRDQFKKGQ